MLNVVTCVANNAKTDQVAPEVNPTSGTPTGNATAAGNQCNDDTKNANGTAVKEKSTNSTDDAVNANGDGYSAASDPYNHLYRKKTRWELGRLSFTMLGTEMVYSIETALISPLLLMYGMKREHVALVWVISPLLGLFLSPVLGSLSDRCKLSIGRRRPFIISLATLDTLGLLLIANSYVIGRFFGDIGTDILTFSNYSPAAEYTDLKVSDRNANDYRYTIISIFIGTILVDFSTDALLNPSRAYVLDVCVTDDHDKGLNASMILAAVGGLLGYLIASVDWASQDSILGHVVAGYACIVFNSVNVLFIICIIVSVTAFKEMPLNSDSTPKDVTGGTVQTSRNKFKKILRSIATMPTYLNIVCMTNLFAWLSHTNFYFYFTHFVALAVFNGDPTANPTSENYLRYEEGVRYACFALAMNCVSSMLYPCVANKLIKKVGIKQVYMGTLLMDAVGLAFMAVYKNKLMVIIVCAIGGVVYCTSFTVPYMLVAQYHDKDMFANQNTSTRFRGLGTDLSIVGACVCLAQLITSMYISKFMTLFGVTFAVIGTSSIFTFLAFITASQIIV